MKDTAIYDKTLAYAVEHNELETYRASFKANMACKEEITTEINKNYTNNHLSSEAALKAVSERFSLERVSVVLAVSIREMAYDGRISSENKNWASTVPFPVDIDEWDRDRNAAFRVTSVHPGLLNLFANALRKELEYSKSTLLKKESLVNKINCPLPELQSKPWISKEQEL